MSVSIRIPDATFVNKIAEIYPIPEHAKLVSLLGGDQAASLKNIVLGSQNIPSVTGSVGYSPGYATVAGPEKYIDTGFVPSGAITFIAVAKDLPASSQIFGTYTPAGGSLSEDWLGSQSGPFRFRVNGSNAVVAGSRDGWKFIAGAWGADDKQTIYVYQADAMTMSQYDYALDNPPEHSLKLGGSSTMAGTDIDVAAIMYYDKGLSAAEIQKVYNWTKVALAARGITLS